MTKLYLIICVLFFSNVLFSDAPDNSQMSIQDPATPALEGMLEFHHYLMFCMIQIGICVVWFLVEVFVFDQYKNLFSQKIYTRKYSWNFVNSFARDCFTFNSCPIIFSSLVFGWIKRSGNYVKSFGFFTLNKIQGFVKFLDKNLIFLVVSLLFVGECYYLYVKFVEFFSIELLSQAADWHTKNIEAYRNSGWWYILCESFTFLITPVFYVLGMDLFSLGVGALYCFTYGFGTVGFIREYIRTGEWPETVPEKTSVDEITPAFQPDLNKIVWDFMVTYQDAIITWGFLAMLLLAAFLCRDESHTLKNALNGNGPMPLNPQNVLIAGADVLHACPGSISETSLFVKRTGVFYGQCIEICGLCLVLQIVSGVFLADVFYVGFATLS